jgi:hypothetical protein
LAQDDTDDLAASKAELEQVMGALGTLFPKEPLTPEQEARLPAAQRIVALMIPEGTMGDIMGKMIDDIVRPMMQFGGSQAKSTLARNIGVSPFEIDLSEEDSAALASLFDPAWAERQEREFAVFPEMMRQMLTLMEPGLRKALAEAYAMRFTDSELADIAAFFGTETGAKYARESFAMASDPRMMGASMEALPAMMEAMGDIEAQVAAATADLPPVRSYDDLSPAERERVIAATGFTDAEIRAALTPGEWAEDENWAEEAAAEETEFEELIEPEG